MSKLAHSHQPTMDLIEANDRRETMTDVDALRGSDDQPSMTAPHTPTPWFFEPPYWGFSEIRAENGSLVFGVTAGGPEEKQPDEVCEANAEFIVTAVNSHADLVEALKEYVAFSPAFRSKPMGAPHSLAREGADYHIALEDRARAALLKATGSKASECGVTPCESHEWDVDYELGGPLRRFCKHCGAAASPSSLTEK